MARGGTHGQIGDIALWAVPAGLIGARLYHVATDHDLYFGEGGDPVGALEIWNGGLGIWGAIAGGLLGAWLYCRRHGILLRPLADALAPEPAAGPGRSGGSATTSTRSSTAGRPTCRGAWRSTPRNWPERHDFPVGTAFHPTFLYEALWNLAGIALLLWLDRRFRLGYGRVFALYVMGYTSGRGWIETLRIDTIELDNVLGLRWGVWMSIVLFVRRRRTSWWRPGVTGLPTRASPRRTPRGGHRRSRSLVGAFGALGRREVGLRERLRDRRVHWAAPGDPRRHTKWWPWWPRRMTLRGRSDPAGSPQEPVRIDVPGLSWRSPDHEPLASPTGRETRGRDDELLRAVRAVPVLVIFGALDLLKNNPPLPFLVSTLVRVSLLGVLVLMAIHKKRRDRLALAYVAVVFVTAPPYPVRGGSFWRSPRWPSRATAGDLLWQRFHPARMAEMEAMSTAERAAAPEVAPTVDETDASGPATRP